jgi:hypothetical protein
MRGGDGLVFDCRGVCDRKGKIAAMAPHRRLGQDPAHVGVSTFGEIPSRSVPDSEAANLALTERLLSEVYCHAIFGIGWVRDLQAKRFYLLDFNARPFPTIGSRWGQGQDGQKLLDLPVLLFKLLQTAQLDSAH